MPVPAYAPTAPTQHPKLGSPSASWTYHDGTGALLGYVLRLNGRNGDKSYRPLCLFASSSGLEWRWEAWPIPRPLFGLDRLANQPDAPVVICEGEKAADAAQFLLPDFVGITSPSGSKSAGKANWSPLKGRDVIIWPDADEAGQGYADTVTKLVEKAGAQSIAIMTPPDDALKGWDAADAVSDGWTKAKVLSLIKGARPLHSPGKSKQPNDDQNTCRPRQRDQLLDAVAEAELWHDAQRTAYASIILNGHREHWPIDTETFRNWIAGRFYRATGGAVTTATMTDAIRVLTVRATEDGACHQPMHRTGWDGANCWLDLCDESWNAIRIHKSGWEVVNDPPVRFIRHKGMTPLPIPEAGHLIEEFRGFINASDTDYCLIIAWLIAALWGCASSYPILALGGEQGSGKSTASRLLRSLVDPNAVAGLAPPKDERDLIVAAGLCHVLAFDNVSKIDGSFSDALCRLATGAGFLTRKLHTDNEGNWFAGARPLVLNGIPSLTERADLADRAMTIRLLRIDEDERRSEDEYWEAWEKTRPGVLGALLDALSSAIRHYDETKLDRMPRMADFARLMAAAEPGLGWEPGTFARAYEGNRNATSEAVFESDPVALAIHKFITEQHPEAGWEGKATDLLDQLNLLVPENQRRSRFWPAKPNALGNAVDRAAPVLLQKGIAIEKHHTGTARLITITPIKT